MNKQIRLNLLTYLVFMLIASAGVLYGMSLTGRYPGLRVWTGTDLLIMLAGIPFLFLLTRAGFPDFWQENITNRKRIAIPYLTGLLFGLFDILVFRIILHPEPYEQLPPFLQPFPYSILLYFSGAFEIEVFYRLIPLTIICISGKYLFNGRYYNYFFVAAAVLTSVREPLEQFQSGPLWLMIYSLSTGFVMNLIQALQFRSAGFVGSFALRLGHYSLWHILLGIYVQYF